MRGGSTAIEGELLAVAEVGDVVRRLPAGGVGADLVEQAATLA